MTAAQLATEDAAIDYVRSVWGDDSAHETFLRNALRSGITSRSLLGVAIPWSTDVDPRKTTDPIMVALWFTSSAMPLFRLVMVDGGLSEVPMVEVYRLLESDPAGALSHIYPALDPTPEYLALVGRA